MEVHAACAARDVLNATDKNCFGFLLTELDCQLLPAMYQYPVTATYCWILVKGKVLPELCAKTCILFQVPVRPRWLSLGPVTEWVNCLPIAL